MPFRSFPLDNHVVMRTTDADYARDRLTSVYGATHFDVLPRGFEAQISHLQMGEVRLYCCDYANQASLEFCETSFIRQIFNLSGTAAYKSRLPGEIAEGAYSRVLQSNVPLTLDISSNYRHFVLSIEQAALKRHLGALLGREIASEIAFHDSTREQAMRRLQRLVFQFASDFDGLGELLSPLAAAEVTRGLVMNFLICHDHSYSNLLFKTPPSCHLSTTKRAEEFIEANWDKPIDIEQLSAVARVSVRTLFRQFKKDRGYAPAEFVRRIRLDRARNMLESGIEGTTVTQAALRCGFQNAGHFAREFRLTFGELPSETLRRALRGPG
jgi:AraC-like DNA-binding protein